MARFAVFVRLRPDRAEPDAKTDLDDPEVLKLVALARLPLDQDLPDDE